MLRKVMGRRVFKPNTAARYASDAEYVAASRRNNELTGKWLNRLRATANDNESREQ